MSSKVLHVIDNMRLGGAQRIVSRLLENNDSHSLHVLRQTDEQMRDKEDYTITESNWRFNSRSFIDVWRLVRLEDPDIVHCHLKKSYFVGLMVKITTPNDFKLVFHEHGEIWKGNQSYNRTLRHVSSLIDKHVAVSKHTAELLQERGGVSEEKIEVIYNFVDQDKFNPEALKNFRNDLGIEIEPDCFTVGFAGRIVERKGWRTIVSAAEKLDDDFQILMTGSGEEDDELEERARKTDNLEYLGYIEDVRSLFSDIDCFVLPSHWDPSPMIFYEIQSCGIPLICSDAHAIDELVEDGKNGLMFEPENVEELVDRINQVESNRDLRKIIVQNGLLEAEKYSYDSFEENLQRMYDNL